MQALAAGLIFFAIVLSLRQWESSCYDPNEPWKPNPGFEFWQRTSCAAVFEDYDPYIPGGNDDP